MKSYVALYLRLSQEDVDLRTNQTKDESNSISAQRALLLRDIALDTSICDLPQLEFCDDGFSGTNFDRPAFHEMIERAKRGEISCIVVKDLSRFGRDYIEVGDYLEHIFPFMGIRFKSVNDHYDSDRLHGNTAGMDVAFQNLIYDYYSKDLSKKVKSAMRAKQRSGSYITACTYGYKVLPNNKHKMVIDPEAASVVRRIFEEAIAGKSTNEIARGLNADGIPTPQVYKGIKRKAGNAKIPLWSHPRIWDMLNNVKYTGCMVNHTRESMTIRATSQRRVPKEEWIVTPNAHEAIVTKEEFDLAHETLRKVRPHSRRPVQESFPIYCAHCGRKLQRTYGSDTYFTCVSAYMDEGADECRQVRWSKTDLEKVLLASLKAQIALMSVEVKNHAKVSAGKSAGLQRRLKALSEELQGSDAQKVKSYLDYREGRITREDFVAARAQRDQRMAEVREELAHTEAEYEAFLREQEEAKAEKTIVQRANKMNDEALKLRMYEAMERVNVSNKKDIEIIWKFQDLFGKTDNKSA